MTNNQLDGLTVSLKDKNIIEEFRFSGNDVMASIGTKNEAVCALILTLTNITPSVITITGQGISAKWEDIRISNNQVSTIRNGKQAIYEITGKLAHKHRERRLP